MTPVGCRPRHQGRKTRPQSAARRTFGSPRPAGAACRRPRRTTSRTAPQALRMSGSRGRSSSGHHWRAEREVKEDPIPQPGKPSPATTAGRRADRCPPCRRAERGSRSTRSAHRSGTRSTAPPPVRQCPDRTAAGAHVKEGRNGRTPGRNTVADPARPAAGHGAGGEGLGRSRGGFTGKLHQSADGRCRTLPWSSHQGSVRTAPSSRQCWRRSAFRGSAQAGRARSPTASRPTRGTATPCREYLRRRGIRHTFPEKTDSQAVRLRKGSRGGPPPASMRRGTSSATPSSERSTS